MNSKDQDLLATLVVFQLERGLIQSQLAPLLGISQGHLSKIIAEKVPISLRLRCKIHQLLSGGGLDEGVDRRLEAELMQAVRGSSTFCDLMRVALKMHKQA